MVGVVLVTHGGIAREMLAATRSIVGPVEQIEAVSTDMEETDDIRERIAKAIEATETGDGVLLVTDMFGGTPANVALSFLSEKKIEVVTGANLPMILKLATGRGDRPLADLATFIREYGQKNITAASSLLQEPKR
jgi:PTS system mannose-specific IIA component